LLFKPQQHLLIGMIHLGPLFSKRSSSTLDEVEAKAVQEALLLAEAGFDAIMIENFGDTPFYPNRVPTHTVAAMTRICTSIQHAFRHKNRVCPKLGVNVLRNDAHSALAIAAAVDAALVRVNVHSGTMITDQGLIQGEAHETCRYRDQMAPNCSIFADLRVKHAAPLIQRPLLEEAKELWERADADAIILTGTQTGATCDLEPLQRLKDKLPECPLVVGSGVTPEQLPQLLPLASGLIVGTWLKVDSKVHNPIDSKRAHQIVEQVRKYAG